MTRAGLERSSKGGLGSQIVVPRDVAASCWSQILGTLMESETKIKAAPPHCTVVSLLGRGRGRQRDGRASLVSVQVYLDQELDFQKNLENVRV